MQFILESLLVGLCQPFKNPNGLCNVHSPFSFAQNFQRDKTIFKIKICPSLGTQLLSYLVLKIRTAKGSSTLHLRTSLLQKHFLRSIHQKIMMLLGYAWQQSILPGMRIFDLLFHGNQNHLALDLLLTELALLRSVPGALHFLPVTTLNKRQFLLKSPSLLLGKEHVKFQLDSILRKALPSTQ